MDPEWTQNGPRMDPEWTQNGSRMDPKWTHTVTHIKAHQELDTHISEDHPHPGFCMSELFRKIDFAGFTSWKTQPFCRALNDRRPVSLRFNSWQVSRLISGRPDLPWLLSRLTTGSHASWCQSPFFNMAHGPRLYVCQAPNAFMCVSGVASLQTPNAFFCVSPNAFICVSPNAFICVSPNAFFVCVTKCVNMCVTKCVCWIRNGARFARLPLLASLARFLTV